MSEIDFSWIVPNHESQFENRIQSGSDYYKLLDIAREIEAERMSADSVNETSKSTMAKVSLKWVLLLLIVQQHNKLANCKVQ